MIRIPDKARAALLARRRNTYNFGTVTRFISPADTTRSVIVTDWSKGQGYVVEFHRDVRDGQ